MRLQWENPQCMVWKLPTSSDLVLRPNKGAQLKNLI